MLTPPGRGAIAVLRVSGPRATRLVEQLCQWTAKAGDRSLSPGQLQVARWGEPEGEQVVLHVRGCDEVDVSCHGGVMCVEAILDDLAQHGVRPVSWPELPRPGAETTVQLEAIEALARAPTLRAANLLLDQYHGALCTAVSRMQQLLREGAAQEAASELRRLLNRSDVGVHLIDPWCIAIVGRPNVGKSSLLNALAGWQRAIVDSASGTTRDLVTLTTALDGWPAQFCDTAGIRPAADELEREGVHRTRRAIERSDRQLVVLDRSRPLSEEDREILRSCQQPLVVANKIDIPAAWDPESCFPGLVAVSALGGEGIEHLVICLAELLVPCPPAADDPVAFTCRQVELLRAAEQSVAAGDMTQANECLAELLR